MNTDHDMDRALADEFAGYLRSVSKEIVTDPGYLTAMKPTGMEPWTVAFDKLQAAIDEDTKSFQRDAEKLNLKFE